MQNWLKLWQAYSAADHLTFSKDNSQLLRRVEHGLPDTNGDPYRGYIRYCVVLLDVGKLLLYLSNFRRRFGLRRDGD